MEELKGWAREPVAAAVVVERGREPCRYQLEIADLKYGMKTIESVSLKVDRLPEVPQSTF